MKKIVCGFWQSLSSKIITFGPTDALQRSTGNWIVIVSLTKCLEDRIIIVLASVVTSNLNLATKHSDIPLPHSSRISAPIGAVRESVEYIGKYVTVNS